MVEICKCQILFILIVNNHGSMFCELKHGFEALNTCVFSDSGVSVVEVAGWQIVFVLYLGQD